MKDIAEVSTMVEKETEKFLTLAKSNLLQNLGISGELPDTVNESNIFDIILEQLKLSCDDIGQITEITERVDFGKVEIDEEILQGILKEIEELRQKVDNNEKSQISTIQTLQNSVDILVHDRAESLFQLEEQQFLMSDPVRKTFYQTLSLKLSRFFLGLAVWDSKLLQHAESNVDRGARWMSLIGGLIPVPMAPAAVNFVLEIGRTIYEQHKKSELKNVTKIVIDLYSMERLAERVARELGTKCANTEKFNELTGNGAKQLAIDAYNAIVDSLKNIEASRPVQAGVEAFVQMAVSRGSDKKKLETENTRVKHSTHEIFAEAFTADAAEKIETLTKTAPSNTTFSTYQEEQQLTTNVLNSSSHVQQVSNLTGKKDISSIPGSSSDDEVVKLQKQVRELSSKVYELENQVKTVTPKVGAS